MGQPAEHGLRATIAANRLADRLALDDATRRDIFFLCLLRWVGCTSHAFELARWFDDEIEAHARTAAFEFARRGALLNDLIHHAGRGRHVGARLATLANALAAGPSAVDGMLKASCEVAFGFAARLQMSAGVCEAIGQLFERWDGRGPRRIRGPDVAVAMRVVQVAGDATVFARECDSAAVAAIINERRGGAYDPAIADTFCKHAAEIVGRSEAPAWDDVLALERAPVAAVVGPSLDAALLVFADFADLKLPFTLGHSRRVADLAEQAGKKASLPAEDLLSLRPAGLLHNIGRTGIPNGVWEKPRSLSALEWERVRLYPYLTDRVLARVVGLERVRDIAAAHQERLDGSGYPRGIGANALPFAARVLQAADVYTALLEARAHRPARERSEAERVMEMEVQARRLDRRAVDAVLESSAHGKPRRAASVALSPREIEVVRLAARGLKTREIARKLGISAHTAGHHLRHVYDKIGVSSRAAAALYLVQHGLDV